MRATPYAGSLPRPLAQGGHAGQSWRLLPVLPSAPSLSTHRQEQHCSEMGTRHWLPTIHFPSCLQPVPRFYVGAHFSPLLTSYFVGSTENQGDSPVLMMSFSHPWAQRVVGDTMLPSHHQGHARVTLQGMLGEPRRILVPYTAWELGLPGEKPRPARKGPSEDRRPTARYFVSCGTVTLLHLCMSYSSLGPVVSDPNPRHGPVPQVAGTGEAGWLPADLTLSVLTGDDR